MLRRGTEPTHEGLDHDGPKEAKIPPKVVLSSTDPLRKPNQNLFWGTEKQMFNDR